VSCGQGVENTVRFTVHINSEGKWTKIETRLVKRINASLKEINKREMVSGPDKQCYGAQRADTEGQSYWIMTEREQTRRGHLEMVAVVHKD
jgi:hypothetical protein